jgi:hypothetical protein
MSLWLVKSKLESSVDYCGAVIDFQSTIRLEDRF